MSERKLQKLIGWSSFRRLDEKSPCELVLTFCIQIFNVLLIFIYCCWSGLMSGYSLCTEPEVHVAALPSDLVSTVWDRITGLNLEVDSVVKSLQSHFQLQKEYYYHKLITCLKTIRFRYRFKFSIPSTLYSTI